MTANKEKLCQDVRLITDFNKDDVALIVDAFLGAMMDSLTKGDRIEIRNFGVFKFSIRKSRLFRDPSKMGKMMEKPLPPKMRVKFQTAKRLQESIDARFNETLKGFQESGSASKPTA